MNPVIEELILKKRKEVYKTLSLHREVRPSVFFIIEKDGLATEVVIRGAETFFESNLGKHMLKDFIALKWMDYQSKGSYTLLATVVISDSWLSIKKGSNIDDLGAIVPPSQDPNRKEAIVFAVQTPTEKMAIYYPYEKKGKNIVFGEPFRDFQEIGGRLFDLFPHQS